MAEHLASIFGTEKDRVNCPFYFKIGCVECVGRLDGYAWVSMWGGAAGVWGGARVCVCVRASITLLPPLSLQRLSLLLL